MRAAADNVQSASPGMVSVPAKLPPSHCKFAGLVARMPPWKVMGLASRLLLPAPVNVLPSLKV